MTSGAFGRARRLPEPSRTTALARDGWLQPMRFVHVVMEQLDVSPSLGQVTLRRLVRSNDLSSRRGAALSAS